MTPLSSYVSYKLQSAESYCLALAGFPESSFCCVEETRRRGHWISCLGAMAWMKMDDSFRKASPTSKSLLLQHQELVNGGKTGTSELGSAVFFFQNCNHRDVIEFTVLFLL